MMELFGRFMLFLLLHIQVNSIPSLKNSLRKDNYNGNTRNIDSDEYEYWVVGSNNGQLTVNLNNMHNYTFSINNQPWFVGGAPNIWCNNSWHSTLDDTLSPQSQGVTLISGNDAMLGNFIGLEQSYTIKSCQSADLTSPNTPPIFTTSILYYNKSDFIEFKQSFPYGVENTQLKQFTNSKMGRAINTPMVPISEFPCFEYRNNSLIKNSDNGIDYMEWGGSALLGKFSFGSGLNDFTGGLEASPLVFYNLTTKSDTGNTRQKRQATSGAVLSSMNNFLNGIFNIRTRRNTSEINDITDVALFKGLNFSYSSSFDFIDSYNNGEITSVNDCIDLCLNVNKYCNTFVYFNASAANSNDPSYCILKYNDRGIEQSGTHVNDCISGVMSSNDDISEMDNLDYLVAGIHGNISTIPANYSISFMISPINTNSDNNSQPPGIRGILDKFGTILKTKYNTSNIRGQNKNRFTLEHLGYWTDNGAYYSDYNPMNTKTAMKVFKAFAENDIPVRYVQLDPYWYDGGSNGDKRVWEARTDLYPQNGLFTLYDNISAITQEKFGFDMPLLLYSAYWTPNSATRNGTGTQAFYKEKYDLDIDFSDSFIIDASWHSPTFNGTVSRPKDYENSLKFYSFILDKFDNVSIGFEIDFMWVLLQAIDYNQNGTDSNGINVNDINAVRGWIRGMNDANLLYNKSMQYCMTLAWYIIDSVSVSQVTNARASGDNFPKTTNRWMIPYSGLLMSTFDVMPFFDNIWTTPVQPKNPYGTKYYKDCELSAIISLLCMGPFGIGDAANYTNKTIIDRAVRGGDGILLHPSHSMLPIDAMFKGSSTENEQVWYTYTTMVISNNTADRRKSKMSYENKNENENANNGDDDENVSSYIIFSVDYESGYDLTFGDLYPAPNEDDYYLVYQFDAANTDKQGPCKNGTYASDCKAIMMNKFGFNDSYLIQTTAQPNATDGNTLSWSLYNLIKVRVNGWTLLGDMMRYVSLSPKRFQSIVYNNDGGFTVTVQGKQSESIFLSYMSPNFTIFHQFVQFNANSSQQTITVP